MRTLGAALLAAALLLAGCGEDREGDVEDAAEEQADAFAAQDFGAAYDMWVDDAKALISRDDYIAWAKGCDLGGVPLEVGDVRLESDTEAVVRIGFGDFQTAYTMRLENGDWSWVPNDESLDKYRQGVDADCP